MAATPTQRRNFAGAFSAWSEQMRRLMEQGASLRDQYTDLSISANLPDADLNAIPDSAGILASDVNTALTIAGQMVAEFTPARHTAFSKIGHGAP